MKLEQLIEQLKDSKVRSFDFLQDEAYEKPLNEIWDVIRRSKSEKLEKVRGELGEAKYEKLIEFVKEQNEEYYVLDYFRDQANEEQARSLLFTAIYENTIVMSDNAQLKKLIKNTAVSFENLKGIVDLFYDITGYCICHHCKGSHLGEILYENYDIPKEMSAGICRLYEQNMLSIKLDYLISMIGWVKDSLQEDEE